MKKLISLTFVLALTILTSAALHANETTIRGVFEHSEFSVSLFCVSDGATCTVAINYTPPQPVILIAIEAGIFSSFAINLWAEAYIAMPRFLMHFLA